MIQERRLFVLLLFALITGYAPSAMADDIEALVQLLSKPTPPTVANFYYFEGDGSETETEFELNVCEEKGWSPPLKHPDCVEYMKRRYANRDKTPSLYYAWLKKKLPRNPKVTVLKVERIEKEDYIPYELIYTTLDDVKVVFYRSLKDADHLGRLSFSQINGVPVDKLLNDDLKKRGKDFER